jgi:5-methylcytosine-specific restriction endonuclease McrA
MRHPATGIPPVAGCRRFCEVTLSARRPCHHVSLPRSRRSAPRRGDSRPAAARARTLAQPLAQKRATKQAALRDCGRRCVYCARPLQVDGATLDHVYPRAHGGTHAPGNLVVACGGCNRLKGDLLPHEFFARHPWAGYNFILYARAVHRALKRSARRAVSLAYAEAA